MKACFAGGCFWCITPVFKIYGVDEVISGYSGGDEVDPKYEDVKAQRTGHREAFMVEYDEANVNYEKLVEIYLANVDPFDKEGQFIDKGFSYTLAIFYMDEKQKEIATRMVSELEKEAGKEAAIALEPYKNFYPAEEYHQDFYLKNPEKFQEEIRESGRQKYDFTSIIDRHGKDAIAVDCGDEFFDMAPGKPDDGYDFIPMWVADMNFATSPSITKALQERISHPLYGYFMPTDEYYNSIIKWQEKHHKVFGLTKEAIGYENGVHGCISSCVEVLSKPGEAIFLHTPQYLGFTSDVEGLGRVSVHSALIKDEDGVYRMDFEDMDKKLKESNCHLAIMCSPHNPAGRVWERWELEKAMEIFEKNEVTVISDEIWADLTYKGYQHIPTQSVSDWAKDNTIAIYAPSKTFNLAGMIGSYHVIYNKNLRDRIRHYSQGTHYNEQNVLSMHALIGAYSNEGNEWYEELMMVLEENAMYMSDFLNSIDGVSATRPQGTYMIFADFTEYCKKNGITYEELLRAGHKVGVGWQDGTPFGGTCHIRLNVALPFEKLKEVKERLEKHVF